MRLSMDFNQLVREIMKDIISENSLVFINISSDEVLLKSKLYALNIFCDNDGVRIIYFDLLAAPIVGYNLIKFLINKREDFLPPVQEKPLTEVSDGFISHRLEVLAQYIRFAAQDIMVGSKEWTKNYPWPVLTPNPEILAVI